MDSTVALIIFVCVWVAVAILFCCLRCCCRNGIDCGCFGGLCGPCDCFACFRWLCCCCCGNEDDRQRGRRGERGRGAGVRGEQQLPIYYPPLPPPPQPPVLVLKLNSPAASSESDSSDSDSDSESELTPSRKAERAENRVEDRLIAPPLVV